MVSVFWYVSLTLCVCVVQNGIEYNTILMTAHGECFCGVSNSLSLSLSALIQNGLS